jgi:long-chain acyl-CoA synthetase
MMSNSDLVLGRLYRWEKELTSRVFLTQPLAGGSVQTYTFGQAMDEARRMASYLRSLGFPAGSSIAILSKNCAQLVLSDIAIWLAGYVSVVIYPTLGADTVAYILQHCDARALFIGKLESCESQAEAVPKGVACISYQPNVQAGVPTWGEIIKSQPPLSGEIVRAPDDAAMIIYTSGSTGKPKGVVHNFKAMAVSCAGFQQVLKLTPEDRFLSYLPLAHVFERAAVESASMWSGCQLFFADSLETFLADIKRARPTLFQSVPRLWLKFQQGVFEKMPADKLRTMLKIPILGGIIRRKVLSGLGLEHARMAVSGSAPIPAELIEWYNDLGLEMLEGYAMSENFAYSHLALPGRTRAGYVGEPLPGVEAKISPQGEVLVKSPGSMVGYHKDPVLTAACFTEDGFLKTGDRGEIDELNRLKLTGRVKELFKTSKGKYVAPAPIENMLNADNHVEQSCVTGPGQAQPFALIMLAEILAPRIQDANIQKIVDGSLRTLIEKINRNLEEHEKLEFLVVVKESWKIKNGLLTPTLKIKRDIIESRYSAHIEAWYSQKTPVIWL